MRKCIVQTRVRQNGGLSPFATLEPFVHKALYDSPIVRKARQLMVDNPETRMIAVETDEGRFYVVTEVKDHPDSIQLDPEALIISEETKTDD